MTDETTPAKKTSTPKDNELHSRKPAEPFLIHLWAEEIREIYKKSPVLAALVARKASDKKPGT